MPQLLAVLVADSSSAETLSGESLWLKRAALPKATPPPGAAYKEGPANSMEAAPYLNGAPLRSPASARASIC